MTKSQTKKANLLLILVVALIVGVIASMFTLGNLYTDSKNVNTENGVFDLSNTNLDNAEQIYLNGEWEFYYRTLLISDNVSDIKVNEYLTVPDSWSSTLLSKKKYPAGGYASYRAIIKNISASEPITIYIPNLGGAYRIYIDRQLVSSSGSFDTKSGKVLSSTSYDARPITLSKNENHEVIIEVAFESFSGLYLSPEIINYAFNSNYSSAVLGLRYIFIGIMLFCSILFMIIFTQSKPKFVSIWLPILSFVLALRMMISTEGYSLSQYLFFFTSYEKMNLFIFVSTFIIKLVALVYLKDALKFYVSDTTLVTFSALFLTIAVGSGMLPDSVYNTYTFALLQAISFIIDIFTLSKLCRCVAEKKPNAQIFTLLYMFISLGVMVDALYTNGFMPFKASSFMPVCFFIYVISIAVIHAKQIASLYKDSVLKKEYESELENANMSIMVSQIQPHFLYNALNTIKVLIKKDPKAAEDAVIDFSYYLRGNMDSLSKTEPIPFSLELEHIKHYCGIEIIRFSDKINIEYQIGPEAFAVPTLSIQLLVENAIKHGITKKPDGGTVILSTSEDNENYYVVVKDNGIGFNPDDYHTGDGKSHVGIDITKKRLKSMLNADMTIESTKGIGTVITISLPKKDNKK